MVTDSAVSFSAAVVTDSAVALSVVVTDSAASLSEVVTDSAVALSVVVIDSAVLGMASLSLRSCPPFWDFGPHGQ